MTRRLQVPRGCTAWLGVDPGTTRVALAACWEGETVERGVWSASFQRMDGGARLAGIWRVTCRLAESAARSLAEEGVAPGVALVEMPAGKQANPALSYATGVIQAAVFEGVMRATTRGVRIEDCSSSWWKKLSTGFGGHRKPKPSDDPESYGVMRWARSVGYQGHSWDEADALGIAEAARKTIVLEER